MDVICFIYGFMGDICKQQQNKRQKTPSYPRRSLLSRKIMNSNDVLEKCVLAINFIALHLCMALSTAQPGWVSERERERVGLENVKKNIKKSWKQLQVYVQMIIFLHKLCGVRLLSFFFFILRSLHLTFLCPSMCVYVWENCAFFSTEWKEEALKFDREMERKFAFYK